LNGCNEKDSKQRKWAIWDLSRASRVAEPPSYLGAISAEGIAQFSTETLPPEMFVSLSSHGLKRYLRYWEKWSSRSNITFDKRLIDPVFDIRTGDTFVVKCHCLASSSGSDDASLPYELIVADRATDIWALGALIFSFCAEHSLFHHDARSGRLAEYGPVCNWEAASIIYESVSDPLVQDLLLKVLANREERRKLNITDILSHPFFTDTKEPSIKARKISDHQGAESAAHKRVLYQKLHDTSEKQWLDEKSVSIQLWDFDLLEKFHASPSEIVKTMMPRRTDFLIPCSFVALPFDLRTTAGSVRLAKMEQIGEAFLHLSKACFFASMLKKLVTSGESSTHRRKLASSNVLQKLSSTMTDFDDVQRDLADLAAKYVESFRHDPVSVAIKLVQQRIESVLALFESGLYLYCVDEFAFTLCTMASSPIGVAENKRDSIIYSGVLFMHLFLLYARGVFRNLDGFASLLYPSASGSIPHSWTEASRGLTHALDAQAFIVELSILQRAMSEMHSTRHHIGDDDLGNMHDFLVEADPRRELGGLRRVLAANTCLWTCSEGVEKIQDVANSVTFHDALRRTRQHVDGTE
jgi:serine/threonine protein kinase